MILGAGFRFARQEGSHRSYVKAGTSRPVVIPTHDDPSRHNPQQSENRRHFTRRILSASGQHINSSWSQSSQPRSSRPFSRPVAGYPASSSRRCSPASLPRRCTPSHVS
ncbi:MAG: type II toxin-antitoxin system HicA family toxin [Syntrophobacteraceae bacterium]